MRSLALVPFLLLIPALAAQRPTPTFEWQKRTATIEFGAVPVGKHTLTELPVGEEWRLGNNEASVMRLDLPLLAGDAIVAPGAYRVVFERNAETKAAIAVAGSGLALQVDGDWRIDGELGKAAKPTKKLDIQWRKKGTAPAGAAADVNQPVQIVVTFGANEWVGDAVVLGHKPFAFPGWKGALFHVPSARLKAGLPTPIATLARGNENWNLVVDKDGVRMVPWMQAPTDEFGFGEAQKPDPARIVTGTRQPIEMKVETAKETADLVSAKKEKGEMRLEIAFGKEGAVFVLPEPKAKS